MKPIDDMNWLIFFSKYITAFSFIYKKKLYKRKKEKKTKFIF